MELCVTLNVGGHIYTTFRSLLVRQPHRNSTLGRMIIDCQPQPVNDKQGHIVIDRDGKIFRHVLNFLRSGKLLLPDDFKEFDMLEEEARYFDIEGLTEAISSIREKREIRVEVRKYEQMLPDEVRQAYHTLGGSEGIFTDWTIYGSYDMLSVINRMFYPESQTPNTFVKSGAKMLRVIWFVRKVDGIGVPRGTTTPKEAYYEEKTEEMMEKLCSLGFSLHSTFDTVADVNIDKGLQHAELHSVKCFIFRKV